MYLSGSIPSLEVQHGPSCMARYVSEGSSTSPPVIWGKAVLQGCWVPSVVGEQREAGVSSRGHAGGLGSKGDLAATQSSEHQGTGLAVCGEPGWGLPCCTLEEWGSQILDLFRRWNY